MIQDDFINLGDLWGKDPPLRPELIEGVLREGHKMLIAGPSKAGKSFSLIELAICIAEGLPWMGRFNCKKGKVLYISLELDRASCLDRFYHVQEAMGILDKASNSAWASGICCWATGTRIVGIYWKTLSIWSCFAGTIGSASERWAKRR